MSEWRKLNRTWETTVSFKPVCIKIRSIKDVLVDWSEIILWSVKLDLTKNDIKEMLSVKRPAELFQFRVSLSHN